MHDDDEMMMQILRLLMFDATGERSDVHSEASLNLEILGDTRTSNTRHR